MNRNSVLLIIILFASLGSAQLLYSLSETPFWQPAASLLQEPISPHRESLVSIQESLFIDGNTDFINQASTFGWSGNGSATNPIILDGITIANEQVTLEISNTDLNFHIRNSNFTSIEGIILVNVTNGIFKNNVLNDVYGGLDIRNSKNILVDANDIQYAGRHSSILLMDSKNITICNNKVFHGDYPGIYLSNSTSSVVKSNTVYDCSDDGIHLIDTSTNNTIAENYIHDNLGDGISLGGMSNYNTIKRNTLNNNSGYGVYTRFCSYNLILENTIISDTIFIYRRDYLEDPDYDSVYNEITNNIFSGVVDYLNALIYVLHSSHTTISNNDFSSIIYDPRCQEDIIVLESSSNSTISSNTLTANFTGAGILIYDSSECGIICNTVANIKGAGIAVSGEKFLISGNSISSINGTGLSVSGSTYYPFQATNITGNSFVENTVFGLNIKSSYNKIKWNNFISNSPDGESQANDFGENNVFEYNYWNNWTSPDTDNDGIVDIPYPIRVQSSSEEKNFDTKPLVIPHELEIPEIIGIESGSNPLEVIVTWKKSSDSHEHGVTYDLDFTADDLTWNNLVSDLEVTEYIWNIENVVNGSHYQLRVSVRCMEGLVVEYITEEFSLPLTEKTEEKDASGYNIMLLVLAMTMITVFRIKKRSRRRN